MALTEKQEKFCLVYVETGNASEAYRQAYDAENMKATTINRKAKEVMDNGKIQARLQELRAPAVEKALLTLEGHLDVMQWLRDQAVQMGNINAAITAEMGRAKAAGLHVTKVEQKTELSGPEGTPIKIAIQTALTNLEMRIRSGEI